MKAIKTIILLLIFSFSFQINAQKPEKKAKKFTDTITEVLSLNKEESEAVYKIQFSRFSESKKIRKENQDNPEIKKEKLKALGKRVFNEMKKTLGKEKMKTWAQHKSKKNN